MEPATIHDLHEAFLEDFEKCLVGNGKVDEPQFNVYTEFLNHKYPSKKDKERLAERLIRFFNDMNATDDVKELSIIKASHKHQ